MVISARKKEKQKEYSSISDEQLDAMLKNLLKQETSEENKYYGKEQK